MTHANAAAPSCFLVDDDVLFRQDLAKELRRNGIDVVEFSNSSRLLDTIENHSPGIVFIGQNNPVPQECIRALFTLKECKYSGVVQLFGSCDMALLKGLHTVGVDFSLKLLPPVLKPIKAATISKIIFDQKLGDGGAPATAEGVFLNDALLRNLVRFLYQPKFELKTNTIISVEIVARVVHPKLGFLTPDQFLKGATEDDLLKLSELALESALAAKVHFHEMGVSLTPAINISAESLLRLPISDIVLTHRMLFEGLTGVIFEIPERQFVSKAELIKARLPKLQRCGVSIAIDNFGRGPTHLDVLNQIPFSEIKIDRSIVENCAANASNAKMCKSFVQIAHNFGARATAVGISNDADFQKLREFGCDIGQGYLLGVPMQMEEIDVLIAKFKNESAGSAAQKAAPG